MERDRSWTIAPVIGYLGVFLAAALIWRDGFPFGLNAFADRFIGAGSDEPAAGPVHTAGPAFTARPTRVADNDDNDDSPTAPATGGGGGGSAGHATTTTGAADKGPIEDACLDGTPEACKRWAMDGFYKAAAAEQAGKLGRALRVSWYGDSVVATDAIPGHLRSKLQGTFGDGGPGFVYLVAPHRFCDHQAITRSNTGDWTTHAISTSLAPDGLYGVGNASAETVGGGATVKLVNNAKVTFVELYYEAQPKGGSVSIKVGVGPDSGGVEILRADTKGDKAAGYATGTVVDGGGRFDVTVEGRAKTFGVDLENVKGAVVDNLGVVSVNVKSFANHDQAAWQAELGHRGADLIMIMIGANEAQWLGPYDPDTKEYPAHYAKVLAPIRAARPDAACLVVSPTDQAEEKDGSYTSRPVMPVLVAAQRSAAKAAGCAFFSTFDWMGGKGSSATWFRKGWISGDFQHLTQKGANKLADAVYDALMAGLDGYEHR